MEDLNEHLYVHVRVDPLDDVRTKWDPVVLLCGAEPVEESPRHGDVTNHSPVAEELCVPDDHPNSRYHAGVAEEWCPDCVAHPNYSMLLLAATEL